MNFRNFGGFGGMGGFGGQRGASQNKKTTFKFKHLKKEKKKKIVTTY